MGGRVSSAYYRDPLPHHPCFTKLPARCTRRSSGNVGLHCKLICPLPSELLLKHIDPKGSRAQYLFPHPSLKHGCVAAARRHLTSRRHTLPAAMSSPCRFALTVLIYIKGPEFNTKVIDESGKEEGGGQDHLWPNSAKRQIILDATCTLVSTPM